MKFIHLLFTLTSIAVSSECFILQQNRANRVRRIERGDSICIKNVPYQVIIKCSGHYICGGALIEPDLVLTAAHCVEYALKWKTKLSVIAGTDSAKLYPGHSLFDRRVKIAAERIVMHPQYRNVSSGNATVRNDIALIKLAEKFPITKRIKPISLPKENVKEDDRLILAGIGKLNSEDTKISPCMKFYKPKVVDCSWYGRQNTESIFCHGGEYGKKTNQGDSGGPMVNSRNELVGIHVASSASDLYQVASNVYYYLKWIHKTMNELSINEV